MMAIVKISHLSQCLLYNHEEYWVSLLMILSTVILVPPNNLWQKAGFEKGLLTTSPYSQPIL